MFHLPDADRDNFTLKHYRCGMDAKGHGHPTAVQKSASLSEYRRNLRCITWFSGANVPQGRTVIATIIVGYIVDDGEPPCS